MSDYKKKIIYGMKNIYVAKKQESGNFDTPVNILGAKNVEVSFESGDKTIYADNKAVYADKRITKGNGKLTLLGLTMDEKCLLAGVEKMQGGFALDTSINAPTLALLFEQDKADGGKLLSVVYGVQFSIPGINAITTEEEMEEQLAELEFTCLPVEIEELGKSLFFYTIDTKDSDVDSDMVQNWFKSVQKPKPLDTYNLKEVKKIDNSKKSDN